MRMMLVGAGAVGESILKVLEWRDPKGEWLEYVLVCDYDDKRAQEIANALNETGNCRGVGGLSEDNQQSGEGIGNRRFTASKVNATDKEEMKELILAHKIDFLMDAAPPFASNYIFDAAYETGIDYGNMGTWSVPMEEPAYGLGIENSYTEPMTKYNFDRHEAWKKRGNMALICLGIDPGVVNVFAKYAATKLLDEITEVHVKDGGNLVVPGADPDDIMFGFNVWTVLDEVMNPNVEYDEARGGFLVDKPFAGLETFEMPDGVGKNTLVKVEHEEVVTMPRYLSQYGLKRATFKISLDDNLITALKVIDHLGLRSIRPVKIGDVEVVPRDVVAVCAPQPKDIGTEMQGEMLVGVQCIGKKDGREKEYFIYQAFDNQESMKTWGSQAVVAQTGFGAALAIELIGKGVWREAGVFSPEYFDPLPYMELMDESGYQYHIKETGTGLCQE
ncbi:saccharopine dehydrogenase family protein [Bariatricus sp. SGI.154]|uniref:saccharopine dehydrogenase family protein n=1 Tax=Bariatricus sp. SGI.154 TaxID=3420549 RepID=UPI003CFD37E9